MLKAITFSVLILYATVLSGVSCELEKATITRSLLTSLPQSRTVPFKGHLYTVSKYESHIHINTTDSDVKPCAILGIKGVPKERLIVTPTDEELFIVVTKTTSVDERYHQSHTYSLLRVNPITCRYQSVSVPDNDFPAAVKVPTGTDVFFSSLQDCAPCRFNNAGLRMSSQSITQFPRENNPPGDRIEHSVGFLKSMNAYVYVYDSFNHSHWGGVKKVKLLDSNDFKIKKERIIDEPFTTISKQKVSGGYLGFCTRALDRRAANVVASFHEVRCERFNSNLETVHTIRIPIEPFSKPISSISYEFDAEGNSYISFAEDSKLQLYIHDQNGKLIKALDVGKVDGKFDELERADELVPEESSPHFFWDTNGFLMGDEYCISIEQSVYRITTPIHHVRCIDVAKYVKH